MQPYFFPYLGYFQLLAQADLFVIYDDVQYIRRGWINRNRILVNGEPGYITVPVRKTNRDAQIRDIYVRSEMSWKERILGVVRQQYRRAPMFGEVFPELERFFEQQSDRLTDWSTWSLEWAATRLGLRTRMTKSSQVQVDRARRGQWRIIDICKSLGATTYINAPGGQALYDSDDFREHSLDLLFLEPALPEYEQSRPMQDFVPGLSIIDVLMNVPSDTASALARAGTSKPASTTRT